jgi:hypothetical protein
MNFVEFLFYRYGDMCPITAAGRVITCLCALFGAATMGMLTSVLVDRYQRVYNRKMYVLESETASAEFDIESELDDETNSIRSRQDSGRRRRFSGAISQHLPSSIQGRRKNDRHHACKLQFIVSFKDRCETDHVTTIMKEKLTEAILTTDIDVNLKLIDDDRKELWTISSSDSQATSTSQVRLSIDVDDEEQNEQSKIENF